MLGKLRLGNSDLSGRSQEEQVQDPTQYGEDPEDSGRECDPHRATHRASLEFATS